jgi:hypothetical protein
MSVAVGPLGRSVSVMQTSLVTLLDFVVLSLEMPRAPVPLIAKAKLLPCTVIRRPEVYLEASRLVTLIRPSY